MIPDIVLRVVPQVLQGLRGGSEEHGELTLEEPLDIGLLAQDERVSRLEEHQLRSPAEPVPLADLLRNHDPTLAGHLHRVHGPVSQVPIDNVCPGGIGANERR